MFGCCLPSAGSCVACGGSYGGRVVRVWLALVPCAVGLAGRLVAGSCGGSPLRS